MRRRELVGCFIKTRAGVVKQFTARTAPKVVVYGDYSVRLPRRRKRPSPGLKLTLHPEVLDCQAAGAE